MITALYSLLILATMLILLAGKVSKFKKWSALGFTSLVLALALQPSVMHLTGLQGVTFGSVPGQVAVYSFVTVITGLICAPCIYGGSWVFGQIVLFLLQQLDARIERSRKNSKQQQPVVKPVAPVASSKIQSKNASNSSGKKKSR